MRVVLRNEVLHQPPRNREYVEPNDGAFVVVRVVESVSLRGRNDVLEAEDLAWLVVVPFDFAAALYFSRAFASEWSGVGEGAVDPPDYTLGAILAFFEYFEVLLVVRVVEHGRAARALVIIC